MEKTYVGSCHCGAVRFENVDVDELARAPVTYVDGRHDNFQSPPSEVRHL